MNYMLAGSRDKTLHKALAYLWVSTFYVTKKVYFFEEVSLKQDNVYDTTHFNKI